jgi:hypothetical protein
LGDHFGIFGNVNKHTGTAGVYGEHRSAGFGVVGVIEGRGFGVVGAALMPIGDRLKQLDNLPKEADGVGIGVWGVSGTNYGVRGDSKGDPKGDGENHNRATAGVYGTSLYSNGVVGQSTNPDPIEDEAHGGPERYGVKGVSIRDSGVYGYSDHAPGVKGYGKYGTGVYAKSEKTIGLIAIGPKLAAEFRGDVQVNGNFSVTGAKAALVKHADGSHRRLYAVESPECWFEDFGETIRNGIADIKLDPEFVALIETDEYHVFLTAYGDSNGLYVSDRTSEGFVVREQRGGTSNCRFSYRVVGRRKDISVRRLKRIVLEDEAGADS